MGFEALPGSPLPAQIVALGYIVEKVGESQRILPNAVAQRLEVSSSGALVPVTEGSTKPLTVTVTNAGIATVEQEFASGQTNGPSKPKSRTITAGCMT